MSHIDKDILYYLAGPMSHRPQFNYPEFFKTAGLLRKNGFRVLSPAEQDDEETLRKIMASPDGELHLDLPSWGDFLSKDVKLVADEVGGVICLDEWWTSRGACVEVFIATMCNKPVYAFDFYNQDLVDLIPVEVRINCIGEKLDTVTRRVA